MWSDRPRTGRAASQQSKASATGTEGGSCHRQSVAFCGGEVSGGARQGDIVDIVVLSRLVGAYSGGEVSRIAAEVFGKSPSASEAGMRSLVSTTPVLICLRAGETVPGI